MKTKALLKFIVAVFAAAICSPQLTQAQTMGGDDVLISSFSAMQTCRSRQWLDLCDGSL